MEQIHINIDDKLKAQFRFICDNILKRDMSENIRDYVYEVVREHQKDIPKLLK